MKREQIEAIKRFNASTRTKRFTITFPNGSYVGGLLEGKVYVDSGEERFGVTTGTFAAEFKSQEKEFSTKEGKKVYGFKLNYVLQDGTEFNVYESLKE